MTVSPALIYGLTGLALFVIGLAGLLLCPQLLRKILAVNVMASGVFLFLVTIAHGSGALIDPVPQAMVLTGIVVSVSSTAVALALLCRIRESADRRELLQKKGGR
ncbi:MAG: cation:proton antiporter subunit C [Desulfurivibrionaceae bacterium]